jgi:hypothetical protein
MEKLTFEHLALYLPYGLKGIHKATGEMHVNFIYYPPYENDVFMTKYPIHGIGTGGIINCNYSHFKPILMLLSDIFEEKNTFKDRMNKLNCSHKVIFELFDLYEGVKTINDISYETYLTMCKNHIDMFGLIPKGLAIDINTLK